MSVLPPDIEQAQGDDDTSVDERARVLAVLTRLVRGHILVSVTSAAHRGTFPSMLLGVDAAASTLTLDELAPASAHALVNPGLRLTVSTRLDGLPVSFRARVLGVEHEDGAAFYRLSLPGTIRRRQRRTHFRVPAGAGHPVKVHIGDAGTGLVHGVVRDISEGGISARMEGDGVLRSAGRGEALPCTLFLSDEERVHARLVICHLSEPDARGNTVVGGRFLDVTPADARVIRRLVARLERDMVRKRPRREDETRR